jgi:glutamyl-tRNA synthetase
VNRTRIAPTPSGFIHLGNAFNFVLTHALAKATHSSLGLRIDDFDLQRYRDEYVEDIFLCLKWLNIKPDFGPKDLVDFKKNHSIQKKQRTYKDFLKEIPTKIYACSCSRSCAESFTPKGAYARICRDKGIEYEAREHALRLKVEISLNPYEEDVAPWSKLGASDLHAQSRWLESLDDFVLWTKNDLAAYQLVSVVEDHNSGIDFIVRGEDLFDSSCAQVYLARCLSPKIHSSFEKISFFHHPLILLENQKKLSKSDDATSLKSMILQGYTLRDFSRDFFNFLNLGEGASSLSLEDSAWHFKLIKKF